MNLRQFVERSALWNRAASGVSRSTRHRISKESAAPTLDTIEKLVGAAGYRTEVTASSFTPLPRPRRRDESPHSSEIPIPLFANTKGQLVGDFKSNAVHHTSGQGGTILLAMLALVAHGVGWETWMIDPKGVDSKYFPESVEIATTDDADSLLHRAEEMVAAGRVIERPILLTIDLASHLIARNPEYSNRIQALIDNGPTVGIYLNIGLSPRDRQLTNAHLLHLPVGDYGEVTVDDTVCRRPCLFLDYILYRDSTDVDYRRFLAYS
ncbi:hypothetical protein CPI83_29390 (plasmid) [Rhodococcus sp. H-CA8f]|uniref:hypothetical protein n=1 Tax=Rhodococcus sp. H-CA8f TaxID=1727214 RepID=UPI000BE33C22|nr:hypothetical protein [Rhodococcus sp. H-CA8f]ATI36317.1 hypothetical protein CPI83_29390 [Rhodococcus sp. H-CA8f]